MLYPKYHLLVLFASLVTVCHGGRILAIFQSQSSSNFRAYEPLVKELAARGHHVTVISSFPQKQAVANYTDIYIPFIGLNRGQKDIISIDFDPATESQEGIKRCRQFLRNYRVKKLIHSPEVFDLILVEFDHHQCFLGFAHKYKNSSMIGLTGQTGSNQAHDLLGNTSPYSYVPDPLAMFTDHMTFSERVTNAVSLISARVRGCFDDQEYHNILVDYFGHLAPLPTINQLQDQLTFVFFCSDVSLDFPRPLLPNMANVAGMRLIPPHKIYPDIRSFLDSAMFGAILVHLGSYPQQLVQSAERELLQAFSKMKYSVLWKRNETIQTLPSNVMLNQSFDLIHVLAHPKVSIFVTHGDLLNIQEAVYHGKPIVGIPFLREHTFNVQRAHNLGVGIRLDLKNVTSTSINWAVDAILSNNT